MLLPTAKPMAVLSSPSIPLAPLLPATLIQLNGKSESNMREVTLLLHIDLPCPYISASRIGILFPRKREDSEEIASDIT